MTDEDEAAPPPYRSYSWEDEEGGRYIALYPGEHEADEERKSELRALGARVAADPVADLVIERDRQGVRPALRLIRGEGNTERAPEPGGGSFTDPPMPA